MSWHVDPSEMKHHDTVKKVEVFDLADMKVIQSNRSSTIDGKVVILPQKGRFLQQPLVSMNLNTKKTEFLQVIDEENLYSNLAFENCDLPSYIKEQNAFCLHNNDHIMISELRSNMQET